MAHTNLALLDAADGRIADALARLDLLLAARPGAVDARLLRSRLRASGDPSGALEDAAAAAALRTTLAEPLRDLGNQLATAGRLPEAARAFARAEALEPGDASNAYNLGLALSRAGDFPGARRTWRHAMGRNPHDARLMRLSALMTGLPWPGTTPDPAAGLALAQQLVRADPSSAEAISTLAAMQLANGLTQDAGQTMQLVAKVERDAAAVRLMEALLVAQEGDPAGGRAIYEQVRSRAKPEGVLRQGLLNQAAAVFGP